MNKMFSTHINKKFETDIVNNGISPRTVIWLINMQKHRKQVNGY